MTRQAIFVNRHTGRDSLDADPVDLGADPINPNFVDDEQSKIETVVGTLSELGWDDYLMLRSDGRTPVMADCMACMNTDRLDDMVPFEAGYAHVGCMG